MGHIKDILIPALIPVLTGLTLQQTLAQKATSEKKRYNILFLLSDDQRVGTIHALGNDEIYTPNLDSLVNHGFAFKNSYIMGGSQGAVCVPNRAMIMTGKYLYNLKETGTTIPNDDVLLGELLQKQGYDTYGTGKWHNGSTSYARSFSSGGHVFLGGMSDQFNVKVWDYDPAGLYEKDSSKNKPYIIPKKNATELFTDDAVSYLENRKGNKPFFLYVAFTSPHDPRTAPEKFRNLYDTAKIKLPSNFLPQHPFDNGELKVRDELLAGFPRTPSEIKAHIRDYYSMISHLDSQIGRIIAALKKSGEFENTIIIFAGDNGLALGQHGLMGKQNVYEHSVKVPLIFAGPGIKINTKSGSFVYLTDIYPTLCDLLHIDIPTSVNSKSFASLFSNPNAKTREALYFGYRNFQRAVRNERYKLIEYNVNGVRTSQLFDLISDPYETRNQIQNPNYKTELEILRSQLFKNKAETGDNTPFWQGFVNNPN